MFFDILVFNNRYSLIYQFDKNLTYYFIDENNKLYYNTEELCLNTKKIKIKQKNFKIFTGILKVYESKDKEIYRIKFKKGILLSWKHIYKTKS